MKKIESKLIAAIVSVLILMQAVPVSAETNNPFPGLTNTLTKQQQKLENAKQRQQIKAALAAKKDIIKNNHETNSALRKEIAGKRTEVKTIRKDIKDNKRQLNSEDIAKIEAQLKAIGSQSAELQATKGTIKAEFALVKAAVKNLKLDEAISHLDKIISIQNTRTEGLKNLNSQMDSLISILKTAVENSTTVPKTESTPQL
jgi:septal ring factor EnvC (AmiA/AmiB activator)